MSTGFTYRGVMVRSIARHAGRMGLGMLAMTLAACSEGSTAAVDACESPLLQGARLILQEAPEGMEPRLGLWYGDDPIPDTLAATLTQVTGLNSITVAELEARDPDLTMLHPLGEYRAADTILVGFDWIRLTGGDGGGWWGQDYKIGFLCESACCRHVSTRLSGTWN